LPDAVASAANIAAAAAAANGQRRVQDFSFGAEAEGPRPKEGVRFLGRGSNPLPVS